MYKEVYFHRRAVAADYFLTECLRDIPQMVFMALLTTENFEDFDDGYLNTQGLLYARKKMKKFLSGEFPQMRKLEPDEPVPADAITLSAKGVSDLCAVELSRELSCEDVRVHFVYA